MTEIRPPVDHSRGTFCEAFRDAVIANVKQGVPFKWACASAGVHNSTVYKWIRRGEEALAIERETGSLPDDDYFYARFALDIDAARAEAIGNRITHIADAGARGQWQADAWWLERQLPDDFGQRSRHEVTGAEGGPIQIGQAEIIKQAQEIVANRLKAADVPELERGTENGA